MEALQVFPVLISNIPHNWQVEQLHNHILAHYIDHSLHHNVLFYSPFIDADRKWLLVLKCMTAQFDLIHSINKATDRDRDAQLHCNCSLSASLPVRPYFERPLHHLQLAHIDCVQHYRYNNNQSMSSTSYNLTNCLCIQLSVAMGNRWCLLPVMPDQWHLIICAKMALKQRIKHDLSIEHYSIAATKNFHGSIVDAQQMMKQKQLRHVDRKLVENASVGFIRNIHWNCHHCFELKDAFVRARSKLTNKKAIFNVCLSQNVKQQVQQLQKNDNQFEILLQLQSDRDCFVKNVRIEMSASMVNRQHQTQKKSISALSRIVDVRSWSRDDILEFLKVCADGKYQDEFLMHNLMGKRLEFLTLDWLIYCNVTADDAKEIIKCKSFFLQCAHIVEEYEMNKGYHIQRNQSAINAKIEQLNELLTECVSMTYVCQNRNCNVFLSRYQALYAYINAYIHDLRLRIQSHDASEGIELKANNQKPQQPAHPKNLHILIENHNDLLRDYASFTHSNSAGNTGCILLRIENIKFVSCIYGLQYVQRVVAAMEHEITELSKRCCVRDRGRYKLRVYKMEDDEVLEYVLLIAPQITSQQFENVCQSLAKIQFQIPPKWIPQSLQTISENFGHFGCRAYEDKLQPLSLKYNANNLSPSKEIEGRPKKKNSKFEKIAVKTMKSNPKKKSSIVSSLSKLVKHKTKMEQKLYCDVDDDDAASVYCDDDDENKNANRNKCRQSRSTSKHNIKQCKHAIKELQHVLTTVVGVFRCFESHANVEYLEQCQLLQNKLQQKLYGGKNEFRSPLKIKSCSEQNLSCIIRTFE